MNRVRFFSRCALLALTCASLTNALQAEEKERSLLDPVANRYSPLSESAPGAEGTATDALAPAVEAAIAAEKSLLANAPEAGDADTGDFCQCIGDAQSVAGSRIERALRQTLKPTGLDFTETPLHDVVNLLQEDYGIPIQLDVKALDEIGLASDEQVTVLLHNISLRSALRLILKPLQLTFIIHDEVLIITTPEAAESQLSVCVYDLRKLAPDSSKPIDDFDSYIDTITSCVATETWATNGGGEAEIRPLKPGLLVISQTQAVHEEVRALLETIRKMRIKDAAGEAPVIGTLPEETGSAQVITRPYYLQFTSGGDVDKVRGQVQDLIMHSIPDEQWSGRLEDGQPVVLSILPDRVVLRHRPAVHEKVQKLLLDSGLTTASPEVAGQTLGGGGGGGFFQPAEPVDNQ